MLTRLCVIGIVRLQAVAESEVTHQINVRLVKACHTPDKLPPMR
ncbi:hypothetical protein S141_36 [Shewanella sp. phage 1/41]|nr:hypothetical protein S141_36 [Shewanella sp. phage 1/41]AHK11682.1 hypothetical protein S141_36 [Shewanella sp. phage 1/41]